MLTNLCSFDCSTTPVVPLMMPISDWTVWDESDGFHWKVLTTLVLCLGGPLFAFTMTLDLLFCILFKVPKFFYLRPST